MLLPLQSSKGVQNGLEVHFYGACRAFQDNVHCYVRPQLFGCPGNRGDCEEEGRVFSTKSLPALVRSCP